MAEARLQATDDLGFEAAHMIRRFLSQPTMEFFRQAKANNPMSRPPFHQGKASDNRSNSDPDNQAGNGNNDDGHGDKTTISAITILRPHPHGHRSSYRLGVSHGTDGSLGAAKGLLGPSAKLVRRIVLSRHWWGQWQRCGLVGYSFDERVV